MSTYAFQLRVNGDMDDLKSVRAAEFCDWDFCRDAGLGNYRAPDLLYMDPAACGFSSLSTIIVCIYHIVSRGVAGHPVDLPSPAGDDAAGEGAGSRRWRRCGAAPVGPSLRHKERRRGAFRVPGDRGMP